MSHPPQNTAYQSVDMTLTEGMESEYETCTFDDDATAVSLVKNTETEAQKNDQVFSWNNIKYEVNKHQILNGVSGHIMKGQLVGILGHSGAGKTSLLNALSGRQANGTLSGEICHNGNTVTNTLKLKERCGYVVQSNKLYPTSTARECMQFAADLRLPSSISAKSKRDIVNSVLHTLQLDHCQHVQVGTDYETGLSGGQAKRVAIGIELITNPQLLFLDEPTSGLDSYTALKTMKILKKLTRNHSKQVLLTIHQPSSQMFDMFDKLILMAQGHCVYFGCSSKVVHYFKLLGYQWNDKVNLADFVLHSIQSDPQFFIQAWQKLQLSPIQGFSENLQQEKALLLVQNKGDDHGNIIKHKRDGDGCICCCCCYNMPKACITKQIYMLMKRDLIGIWRCPVKIKSRFLSIIGAATALSTLYWDLPNTMRGAQDLTNFSMFMASHSLVSGITHILQILPEHRIIYEHERASKTYSTAAYVICKLMFLSTVIFIETAFLSYVTTKSVLNSTWNVKLWQRFWCVLFLGSSASGAFGAFISCFAKSLAHAMTLPPMITPLLILNGITVDIKNVSPYIGCLRFGNFLYYMMNAVIQVVFADRVIVMSPILTVTGEEYLDYLGIGHESLEYNFVALAAFVCGLWTVSLIVLVCRNGM